MHRTAPSRNLEMGQMGRRKGPQMRVGVGPQKGIEVMDQIEIPVRFPWWVEDERHYVVVARLVSSLPHKIVADLHFSGLGAPTLPEVVGHVFDGVINRV